MNKKPVYLKNPSFKRLSYVIAWVVEGVHDTGMTSRALLPIFPQPEREMLKLYKGMATLVDIRVVCLRPTIDDLEMILN
jgi:hypothetical protein